MPERSGLVLAGGESRRMGRDKGLLELEGRPLVLWVVDRLRELAEELVVSTSPANDAAYRRIVPAGVACVPDEVPGTGPLGGWRTALSALRGEYVAMAPCDTPFYEVRLGEALFARASGHDAAVPRIGKWFEPLHGVYRREPLREAVRRTVAMGLSRPVHTYAHLDVAEMDESSLRAVDPDLASFWNANTPEDFERLRAHARQVAANPRRADPDAAGPR